MSEVKEALEDKLVINKYRQLLRHAKGLTAQHKKSIRKAYKFAVEAHKDMKRKSGEPYVVHPIEVAIICARDLNLSHVSIISALLHDVVEDTDYSLNDIELMFGKKVAKIIDGLTKISGLAVHSKSMQAENFRKILLTLNDDVRVILIKLADRLHNMRTLGAMPQHKKLKIASETNYLYAPLAHRLGLFAIKSELEDLALKYKEPEAYDMISNQLKGSEENRRKFINKFTAPIRNRLNKLGLEYKILSRTKSISSIWGKMQSKKVNFDEIYDIFAVRIVINSTIEKEKVDCWRVYGSITDLYYPKQDRFRDWISVPKANGYEALHTTVMSNEGKWVEIQIRSERMDEVAEKGYAAHWKYKENSNVDIGLEEWLVKIRELLENPDQNALRFLDDFKLNLFSEEIFTFTPKGELKTLPKGSTVLDFAYNIHSEIGNKAIGAKVNSKLEPFDHELITGDQVEILTSNKQSPNEDWLEKVITARAKGQIKSAIKENRKKHIEPGKEKLANYFHKLNMEMSPSNVGSFKNHCGINSNNDFYYLIDKGKIGLDELKDFQLKTEKDKSNWMKYLNPFKRRAKKSEDNNLSEVINEKLHENPEEMLLTKQQAKGNIDYEIADCCNPIPGDDVIGFFKANGKISIHRTNCEKATRLSSTYGHSIVKTKWRKEGNVQFLTGIKIYGYDKLGMIMEITQVLSSDMNVNIRSLNIESSKNLFEGIVTLYVQNTKQVERIISKLFKIKGVDKVYRIN